MKLLAFDGQKDETSTASLAREWDQMFNDYFWAQYPRRISKQEALKAWRRHRPRTKTKMKDKCCAILELLEQRMLHEWDDRDKKKMPYPATFLNGESFSREDW